MVTVVCGALDPVDVLTVAVWGAVGPRLRQTFFVLAAEEVERHAGTLACFGADAVLMLFAQEAHAQRAVRAAFALQRRVQDWASALDARLPTDISVRVGVHTGPLAMPSLTDVPWCSSWGTAETTTMAIWLHHLAMPGTLLASHATLPFLHGAVRWAEQGAARVPGQAEPIMTYRIDVPPIEDTCSPA